MFIGYDWSAPLQSPPDAGIKGEILFTKSCIHNSVIQEMKRERRKAKKLSPSAAILSPPLSRTRWSWRGRRAWRASTPPPSHRPPTPPFHLILMTAVSGTRCLRSFRWAETRRRGGENGKWLWTPKPYLKLYLFCLWKAKEKTNALCIWNWNIHLYIYCYLHIYQLFIHLNKLFSRKEKEVFLCCSVQSRRIGGGRRIESSFIAVLD